MLELCVRKRSNLLVLQIANTAQSLVAPRSVVQIFATKMVALFTVAEAIFQLTFMQVLATQAIANVVKSSFGPSGLDKMMVDDIGVSKLSPKARAV